MVPKARAPKRTGKLELTKGSHLYIRVRYQEESRAGHARDLREATAFLRYCAGELDKLATVYEEKASDE